MQAIAAQEGKITIRLRRDARIDIDRLVRFVADRPGTAFSPTGVLTLETRGEPWLELARDTLEVLS